MWIFELSAFHAIYLNYSVINRCLLPLSRPICTVCLKCGMLEMIRRNGWKYELLCSFIKSKQSVIVKRWYCYVTVDAAIRIRIISFIWEFCILYLKVRHIGVDYKASYIWRAIVLQLFHNFGRSSVAMQLNTLVVSVKSLTLRLHCDKQQTKYMRDIMGL